MMKMTTMMMTHVIGTIRQRKWRKHEMYILANSNNVVIGEGGKEEIEQLKQGLDSVIDELRIFEVEDAEYEKAKEDAGVLESLINTLRESN